MIFPCLFAEFDADHFGDSKEATLAHIRRLAISPSVIIDSGGGYHCYWLLVEPFALDDDEARSQADRLQKAWVELVGSDNGAKDLARVLRVPGTRNFQEKYAPDFPTVTFVSANLEHVYGLEELKAVIPAPERAATRRTDRHAGGDQIGQAAAALERLAPWRCDDYNAWLEVGMALSELGDIGLELWDRWSEKSAKYEPGQCAEKWGTFTPGNGLTLASLFHWANGDDGRHCFGLNGATPVGGDYFLSQSADDEGNAQCVFQLYGDRFVYCEAYGWLHYNGRYWEIQRAEAVLERAIVDTLQRRRVTAVQAEREAVVRCSATNTKRVRDCKFLLKSLVTADVGDFDNSPDLLNCRNGVVDLRTGHLMAHSPTQRFTYCLTVDYDPEADSTDWERFLLEVVGGDEGLVEYLQVAVGYSFTGHTREECLFYIYGPTRGGKGTFVETLLQLMGRTLAAEMDFNTFTASRDGDANNFDLAPLKPCRFVAASESRQHQVLNAAKIKQLTGGNEVRCAFKHKTHFNYRPQYKIWLSSNFPVQADVDDDAVWNRLKVIEFPNSYAGREDKTLKERMKSPDNLSGVLAWAVRGAIAWYRSSDGLQTPQQVVELTSQTRLEQDHVEQWLNDCVVTADDPTAFISNASVYRSYQDWCYAYGETEVSKRALTQALKRKGYQAGSSVKLGGRAVRGVKGIRLV